MVVPIAFFTGWFLTRSLTVHPVKLYFSVFILSIFVCLSLAGIVLFLKYKSFIPILIGLCCFLLGYLINARIFLSRQDSRYIPPITRVAGASADHTAIVYFTHGEPETFNPIGWINQFREFDEQGIRFIPFFARPAFIYALRQKYLEVGRSNHRQGHINMLKALEAAYRIDGDSTTRFYLSFLDDEPRPDAAVIEALNDGASRIVVATVFLTISNHTAEGKHLIEQLDVENNYKVPIRFSDPLWDSEILVQAFIDKVMQNIGDTPKEKVAVALIGHGQPDEWDKEWPTETAQEIKFRERVIEKLVTAGFERENLGNAWMEFKVPKPRELMDKLVKNDAKKILYFASAISADAIHSQADIPALVHEYPFPDNIEVINLGAWNAHPLVIKAIKEKTDQQLAGFKQNQ